MKPRRRTTLKKQIADLTLEVRDLQAYCGVLLPLFEKEYKRQGYDFSELRMPYKLPHPGDRKTRTGKASRGPKAK
jgi:hypothetical protein